MFNFLVNVLHVSLKENRMEQHKESIFLLLAKNCSRWIHEAEVVTLFLYTHCYR